MFDMMVNSYRSVVQPDPRTGARDGSTVKISLKLCGVKHNTLIYIQTPSFGQITNNCTPVFQLKLTFMEPKVYNTSLPHSFPWQPGEILTSRAAFKMPVPCFVLLPLANKPLEPPSVGSSDMISQHACGIVHSPTAKHKDWLNYYAMNESFRNVKTDLQIFPGR